MPRAIRSNGVWAAASPRMLAATSISLSGRMGQTGAPVLGRLRRLVAIRPMVAAGLTVDIEMVQRDLERLAIGLSTQNSIRS